MTTQEFSNAFDTLLNSYNITASFGEDSSKAEITLDEYEKSVFLTQAQDVIVRSYFDRTLNPQGQGFDDSPRRQVDFSSLVKVTTCAKAEQESVYDSRGVLYKMPDKVLFVLNEKVVIEDKTYVVVPINYKEYDRQMSKAYTQPLKNQCWRLFQGDVNSDLYAELIPHANAGEISAYVVRYVERPTPIVLVDLGTDDLDIDGVTTVSECSLNKILHLDILQKAVELAIMSKGSYADHIKNRNQQQNK